MLQRTYEEKKEYEVVVVAEELDDRGLLFSFLGVAIKMNFNMGEAQACLGVAREEKLVAELSILNSMLHFGVGEAWRLRC